MAGENGARTVPTTLAPRIPHDFARANRLVPIEETPARVVVAAAPPIAHDAIAQLEAVLGKPVEVVETTQEEVEIGQERLWGRPRPRRRASDIAAETHLKDASGAPANGVAAAGREGAETTRADTGTTGSGLAGPGLTGSGAAGYRIGGDAHAPAVRAVTEMLARAIRDGASDVHVERYRETTVVRERVDGILHDVPGPPVDQHAAVVARVKALAHLRLDETRRPQDGQFSVEIHGRAIDVRVSIIPGLHGEGVVMRLLDRASVRFDLGVLGFPDGVLSAWRRIASLPHGLVLVTGPTGSGKTTTLYATLQECRTPERKVVTVEDPVEYEFEGIMQAAVHPKTMTFAQGLRAYLRHDPDVILVGEIRDPETAKTAIEAALTGHLVFSTLHTNDAVSAVSRLIELGVEPYLLADALTAVMAQRLVRTVCRDCAADAPAHAEPYWDAAVMMQIPKGETVKRGRGCAACLRTGYRGRTGIYEILEITPALRDLIGARPSSNDIAVAASPRRVLLDDGRAKVAAGVTTPEEVMRVIRAG